MPAYLIARVEITHPDAYRDYMQHTPRVIAQYGGRFIARGADVVTVEGPAEERRIVVIEFPDAQAARSFYGSPEYTAVKKLREGAGAMQSIIVDGLPAGAWDALVTASQAVPPPVG